MLFDDRDIGCINSAVRIYVVSEIRRGNRLASLRFGLRHVRGVDRTVAVRVPNQHAEDYARLR